MGGVLLWDLERCVVGICGREVGCLDYIRCDMGVGGAGAFRPERSILAFSSFAHTIVSLGEGKRGGFLN